MPLYTIKHKKTGEKKEVMVSLTEYDQYFKDLSGEWIRVLATPLIIEGIGSALSKSDEGWKDTLRAIKRGSGKDNTINV